MSWSSAGGSQNLLLPTPQHTPSLAGPAITLSLPISLVSTVTALPSTASAVPQGLSLVPSAVPEED